MSAMTPELLDTPCAVIDEARMARNIERMQQRMNALGVTLRPHVKTAKCIEVARRQRAAGAVGITVSTLKEAEQFFAAGFADVLYAVGITPAKLAQARSLQARGCRLRVIVDSIAAAQAVATQGQGLEVLIEIDCDGHRSGVPPESERLLQMGRLLHDGGATLSGVMTHAGGSYACNTEAALVAFAEQERSRCVHAAQRMREAGLPCPVVSVGSTPTALSARQLDGVTEVRAGVYVFHDLVMLNVGVASRDELALSVLASVIGHQSDKGWVLVDAGWRAMSRDRGTQTQAVDHGYGAVCDEAGRWLDDFVMTGANQEHGIVALRDDGAAHDIERRFPLGTRLRILPNPACATAAQYSSYAAIAQDGGLATWERFGGW